LNEELERIAARIRAWRNEAGFTLQQLGTLAGVSASTIHKIENLQTVPTIAVLLKVANGLNRRPSELLTEANIENQVAIVRAHEQRPLAIRERVELVHLVGMISHNRLDAWRVHLEPGMGAGMNGGDPWKFQGEGILLIEEGAIETEIGDEVNVLEKGDTIHFDSSLPHRWIATGTETARAIVLFMIPERLQGDLMSRISDAAAHLEKKMAEEAPTD
jgi:transcriptional regulator with XRE-family HTH domain